MRRFAPLFFVVSLLTACDEKAPPSRTPPPPPPDDVKLKRFSVEELKDPENCKTCHKRQYDEWAMSMHAYASKDPVFLAMNKRGQRETNGELGSFCVQCHAPVALRDGLTTDGLNLEQLPEYAQQGVTCYFCHNAVGVGPSHVNADVMLANDDVMRGAFTAIDPGRHGTAKSSFHETNNPDSSRLCGTCHDVKLPNGLHIERSYAEYKNSMFSLERHSFAEGGASCQFCHMPVRKVDFVSSMPFEGMKKRELHEHIMPGVDIAITDDFPNKELQRLKTRCFLGENIKVLSLEVDPLGRITVALEHDAGHMMPSGAAQDRRLWLELIAYDQNDKVIFETGTIGPDEVEELPNDTRPNRPLCMFRDHFFDENDNEVHMFWDAHRYTSKLMPVGEDKFTPHTAYCNLSTPGNRRPARIEMVMKMRPIGIDVLQDLVDSGDLDPKFIERMPTFEIHNTRIEWRAEQGSILEKPAPAMSDPECDELAEPEF